MGIPRFSSRPNAPGLVRGLALADASPAQDDAEAIAEVEEALASWPIPFASRDSAVQFFGGPSLAADLWADGLEQRDDGLWPRFDAEVMARTLRKATSRPYWTQWETIRCPTLVVRAGNGTIDSADAKAMALRLPHAQLVELAGAEHDLHLDRPAEWARAMSDFLDSLDR